jgi:hypothetical protein
MIPEFKSIFDLLKAFPDEQSCINHLEMLQWGGTPISPFDPISKVYKCAGNKYKCKNTGKYFNVRTGRKKQANDNGRLGKQAGCFFEI